MNQEDKIYFNYLKNKISETFLQEFPGTNSDISQWKGIEIVYFQEHLLKKVRGNVSEKWFYTYFKQEIIKLPRIDMLNLLSEYVGFKSWNHLILENKKEINDYKENLIKINNKDEVVVEEINTSKLKINYQWYFIVSFCMVLMLFLLLYINKPPKYTFCFFDSESKLPIKNFIEISINKKGETSKKIFIKDESCFDYTTNNDTLEMVINSKFYKSATYKYILRDNQNGPINVSLVPDEYALMLNYYVKSTQKIKDRQNKLRYLISNDALIYQIYDNKDYGVEILTKEQYIGLLTLPTESLKNYIQIFSEEKNGKIVKIKFKINKL